MEKINCEESFSGFNSFSLRCIAFLAFLCLLLLQGMAVAQSPQTNYYLDQTWTNVGPDFSADNGGLSSPFGISIAPDGRVYVADSGYGRIQVYLAKGNYKFSIANGFGGGQSFANPRGMISPKNGNLYIADYGSNCVFQFSGNGAFVRKFGGVTGTNNGELMGVVDVAVSSSDQVYVLESLNRRISVFNSDGTFSNIFVGPSAFDGPVSPSSIAISQGGRVFVSQDYTEMQPNYPEPNHFLAEGSQIVRVVKAFAPNGNFLFSIDLSQTNYFDDTCTFGRFFLRPCSIRVDDAGFLHVIDSICGFHYDCILDGGQQIPMQWVVFDLNGAPVATYPINFGPYTAHEIYWPCHAVGPDGTMVICNNPTGQLKVFRYAPFTPTVTIQFSAGGLTFTWTAGGVLQSADSPTGPFTDIDGATSPYTIVTAELHRFFRVKFPN